MFLVPTLRIDKVGDIAVFNNDSPTGSKDGMRVSVEVHDAAMTRQTITAFGDAAKAISTSWKAGQVRVLESVQVQLRVYSGYGTHAVTFVTRRSRDRCVIVCSHCSVCRHARVQCLCHCAA